MRRAAATAIASLALVSCEITPEMADAIFIGLSQGLADAQSTTYYDGYGFGPGYSSGYGYGGVLGRTVQLCVRRAGEFPRVAWVTIRNGSELNRMVGGNVYRIDRDYVSVPTLYGSALVSIPAWTVIDGGPIYGFDQQGGTWVLSSPVGCG